MRNSSSITQLIIGTAVVVGMSVIAISAVAQSTAEPSQSVAQEFSHQSLLIPNFGS